MRKEVLEDVGLERESKLRLDSEEGKEGRLSIDRVDTQDSKSHSRRVIAVGRERGKKKVLAVSDILSLMSCCCSFPLLNVAKKHFRVSLS
jgi:hypothetical protein